jgi:hypothetical protein
MEEETPWGWNGYDSGELEMLRMVINLVLYMQMPDADVIEEPGKLAQKMAGRKPKSRKRGGKRGKAKGEAYEFLVGTSIPIPRPESPESSSGNESEGPGRRSPRPHWRDGSFVLQPCGKGSKDRKITWRKPSLVRKDAVKDARVEGLKKSDVSEPQGRLARRLPSGGRITR